MPQRAETIQKILDDRKPITEKTAKTIGLLQSLNKELVELGNYLPKIRAKCDPDKLNPLENDLSDCRTQLQNCWTDLDQLRARFDRSTFNIGIVGNAGQGKSTFLQTLTGLSNEEIPAAPGVQHCTGAPSIIVNDTEVFAEVEFYTAEEFLQNIIRPFYDELTLDNPPETLADFRRNTLPEKDFGASQQNLYDSLKRRQQGITSYENLLGQAKKRISRNEFREYIAQQDTTGRPLFKWIAVRMVTVHCPFQVSDVGKVAVCDTPGLGDFVCGAEGNLIRNIAENLDAVTMLKMVPKTRGVDARDTNLYDLLPKAIDIFAPSEWSYFIVNRSEEDSDDRVAEFQADIRNRNIAVRRMTTLNALKREEVLSGFDQILNDITENQQRLDERLYKARYENVNQALRRIRETVRSVQMLIYDALPTDESDPTRIQTWFQDCWRRISEGLHRIVEDRKALVRNMSGQPESAPSTPQTSVTYPTTGTVVETTVKRQGAWGTQKLTQPEPPPLSQKDAKVVDPNVNAFLKKLEKITHDLEMRDELKNVTEKDFAALGLAQFMADRRHALRHRLTKEFDTLDEELTTDCKEVRRQIYEVLTKQGKLGGIIPQTVPDDWFEELAKLWDGKEGAEEIQRSLRRLLQITISFQGYLLPEIREKLSPLQDNANLAGVVEAVSQLWTESFGFDKQQDNTWDRIHKKLQDAWKESVQGCRSALRELAVKLEKAKIAVIDDFFDSFIRFDGPKATEDRWYRFYYDHRHNIWKEEFAGIKANKEMYDLGTSIVNTIERTIGELQK